MVIIINELSFSGQFIDVSEFLKSLRPFLITLRTFETYKYLIFKNCMFFSLNVTGEYTIGDLFRDRVIGSEDEIRGLRNQLVKFTNNPPYWDENQKHSCNDNYICKHTSKTCNYGLAEALENYSCVISISNTEFLEQEIQITKNGIIYFLKNISSLENLSNYLVSEIENGKLSLELNNKINFPYISISKSVLSSSGFYKETYSLSEGERIAQYRKHGHNVAIMNGWQMEQSVTKKNDRSIYCKRNGGRMNYLSIDTEHGTFELFDQNGSHLGEVNFSNEKMESAKGHRINV